MPSRETVDVFIAHVMSEDHVGAIERYYAEDASMQENLGEPRVGRATLMEGERRMLARWTSVKTELLGGPLIDGDTVAIRWRFTFTPAEGKPMVIEEIAWQVWAGDKVQRETFFYDPAQRGG